MHVNTAQGKELLLLALREVVPTARSFTDKALEAKLGKEKLQEASEQVLDYLEQGVSKDLSRNEQIALTSKVVSFLANHLRSMQVPITLNNLMNNMGLLSEAVENYFPSYAESRLLRYIIAPVRA